MEMEKPASLADRYQHIRTQTLARCAPLEPEDYQLQPMADVSPAKWHLAHTSWFFETFILLLYRAGYSRFHLAYEKLFNSYYLGVGEAWPRAKRGHLSRPTLQEILAYRAHIDQEMLALLSDQNAFQFLVCLGLHHEQQHQELLLTDIKYCLGMNPLRPAYDEAQQNLKLSHADPLEWIEVAGGAVEIGSPHPISNHYEDFVFDNETPRHQVLMHPYAIASRLITNGEFLQFIEDKGYQRPELWLAEGWAQVQEHQWCHPLYWQHASSDAYTEYQLTGPAPLDKQAPVSHMSFYEAEAYARWRGVRLPTEAEWEHSAHQLGCQPSADEAGALKQMFGSLWQWTASPYAPYPRFKPFAGAVGEYNGKFMSAQLVLKGSSIATPPGHARITYRNFFYPKDRWQFTGIRLAKDC